MKALAHLALLSAGANLVASIVIADTRKPGAGSAKFLASAHKGYPNVQLSKACTTERDKFAKSIDDVRSKTKQLNEKCSRETATLTAQIKGHDTAIKQLRKDIRRKKNETHKPRLFMQEYGLRMCSRLKDGLVMKPGDAKARKEFKDICDGKLMLQKMGTSSPSNKTMPSMPPHRRFPQFVARSYNQPMQMPPRKTKCAQSKTVYEELKKNVDGYNKLRADCVKGIRWYRAKLKKVYKERHKLEAQSSGVMKKEPLIKDCVAEHIKHKFCNYKKAAQKSNCNCPCMPSPAKVFYDKKCPPTAANLPTPRKCRPEQLSLSKKKKKKSLLELRQHPGQPACDCAATCMMLAIR